MLDRRQLLARTAAAWATAMGCSSGARAQQDNPLDKILQSDHVRQRFGAATDANIDAYERRYKTKFSASYRSFLKRVNGMTFSFDFDAAKKAGISPALADMNTFFGIGNGVAHNDLELVTPKMRFHDPRLLSFAPIIGLGGDFCTYLEINQGEHAGKIMYTDGEMFSMIRKEPIETRSVDDNINHFIKIGWCMPVAPSYDALLSDYAKMI
jgi:hypothetical protein